MTKNNGNNFKLKIKKILVELLIFAVKSLIFLFQALAKAFFIVVGAPFLKVARFVFYKFVVKIYCHYFSLVKKIGWNRQKSSFFSFLFNEKIVHVVIGVITFFVVLVNLVPFTKAQEYAASSREAIIYNLVQSEFEGSDQEEELIKESLDKENLTSKMSTQKKYRDQFLALKQDSSEPLSRGGAEGATSTSQEVVEKQEVVQDTSEDQASGKDLRDRDEIVKYEVKTGDTISSIADKFGVSVDTVLWENDLSAYDLIRPGEELVILPVSGVTHKVERGESLSYIANQYDADQEDIMETNDIDNPERLSIGEKLIIPGGEKPDSSDSSSQSSSQSRTSGQSALSAVKDVVSSPQPKTQTVSDKMHWPTPGHRITQYYSWRHHGLDVADNIGTPLYAAESGVVEFVGWSRGYGNNIVINHGGGKKTRYAHMHQFYVSRGERVSKGQTLGEMGNTGWSSGPHVHFEVVIKNRRQNPLNYIK